MYRNKRLYNELKHHFLQNLKQKMYDNPDIMKKAWITSNNILQKYPPVKNENKFIYGICCERIFIRCMNEIETCECLDDIHHIGSSYKNDCNFSFLNMQLSIKCTKSGGSIILVNKLNKSEHDISGLHIAIIHFQHRRIYLFIHTDEFNKYIKSDGATVRYKASLFTFLKKNPKFYYEFPIEFDKYIVNNKPISIYNQIVDNEFKEYNEQNNTNHNL